MSGSTNPYAYALAQRLAPGQGGVVDPRAAIAKQLTDFKAAPVTTAGAGIAQALAAALSGAAGGYLSGKIRDDQQQQRTEGLDVLRQQSDAFRADERAKEDRQRQEAQALFASIGMPGFGGGAPPAPAPAGPASMPSPGPMPTAPAAPVAPMSPGTFQGGNAPQTVRADNGSAAAQREAVLSDPNMTPEQRDAALRQISLGRAAALTGTPVGAQYRAPEGVNGVFAGLPAPAQAPAMPTAAPSPSPMPAAAGGQPDLRNAAIMASASGNPLLARAAGPLGQLAAAQQQAQSQASTQSFQAGQQASSQAFSARQAEATREDNQRFQREEREARERAERARADEARRQAELVRTDTQSAREAASRDSRLATVTQQEGPLLERIASNAGIIANGERLLGLIDKDKISFSALAPVGSALRGAFNSSSEADLNRSDLQRHVTESVNAILAQAAGPQTDQDAQRARDQILANLNDKEQVRRGLQALNGAATRAREIATARVQNRRQELGLPGADLSAYSGVRPNLPEQTPSNPAPTTDPLVASRGELPRVASVAEARSLPSGTRFIDPNGVERMVP